MAKHLTIVVVCVCFFCDEITTAQYSAFCPPVWAADAQQEKCEL